LQRGAAAHPLLAELDMIPPEFVEVTAADGAVFHGALYRPAA